MNAGDSPRWDRMVRPPVIGFAMALVTLFTAPATMLLWGEPDGGSAHLIAAAAAGIWWIPSFWAALQVSRGVRPLAATVVVAGWLVIGAAAAVATGMVFVLIAWLVVAALVAGSYWSARTT